MDTAYKTQLQAEIEQEQLRVEFEGSPVKLGKKVYIIPGLSFGQIERLTPLIERLDKHRTQGGLTPAIIKDITTIIHAAIARNYPDIKTEDVKNLIDSRNAMPVVAAIMGASGFVKATGETTPVA